MTKKKEKNEALKLLQNIFSFSDDEMTELINYFYDEEDLKNIDILVSKLLVKFYGQGFQIEEEPSESIIDKNISLKRGIDIDKKLGLRDVINSLKYEKKLNKYKVSKESEEEDEDEIFYSLLISI